MENSNSLNWLFGRGISIACGLAWAVPEAWLKFDRVQRIEMIKQQIRLEMNLPQIDCRPIRSLLQLMATRSERVWRHRLITTNWDYLLQREVLALNLSALPRWLANSHVFHLNGSAELLKDNSYRSPFLLEEDPGSVRISTAEADIVYNQMIWDHYFIVVGMSFECQTDRFLLSALKRVEDDMPIGESSWLIINRDQGAVDRSVELVRSSLPSASVSGVCASVEDWLDNSAAQQLEKWGQTHFSI